MSNGIQSFPSKRIRETVRSHSLPTPEIATDNPYDALMDPDVRDDSEQPLNMADHESDASVTQVQPTNSGESSNMSDHESEASNKQAQRTNSGDELGLSEQVLAQDADGDWAEQQNDTATETETRAWQTSDAAADSAIEEADVNSTADGGEDEVAPGRESEMPPQPAQTDQGIRAEAEESERESNELSNADTTSSPYPLLESSWGPLPWDWSQWSKEVHALDSLELRTQASDDDALDHPGLESQTSDDDEQDDDGYVRVDPDRLASLWRQGCPVESIMPWLEEEYGRDRTWFTTLHEGWEMHWTSHSPDNWIDSWAKDVWKAMHEETNSEQMMIVAEGKDEETNSTKSTKSTNSGQTKIKSFLLLYLFLALFCKPPHPTPPHTIAATTLEREGMTHLYSPPSFLPAGASTAMAQWSAVAFQNAITIPWYAAQESESTRQKLLVANGIVLEAKQAERVSVSLAGNKTLLPLRAREELDRAGQASRERLMKQEVLRCITGLYSSAAGPEDVTTEMWEEGHERFQFCASQTDVDSADPISLSAKPGSIRSHMLAPFAWVWQAIVLIFHFVANVVKTICMQPGLSYYELVLTIWQFLVDFLLELGQFLKFFATGPLLKAMQATVWFYDFCTGAGKGGGIEFADRFLDMAVSCFVRG